MMRSTKRLVAVSALTAALGAAGLGWWTRAEKHAEHVPLEATLSGMPLRAGDVHSYKVELRTVLGAAGGTVIDYTLTGTWAMTVLRSSADGSLVRATLEGAELEADGKAVDPSAQSKLEQAKRDFAQPITYRVGPDGTLGGVADSADVELQVRSMMRSIAAAMQVVRSSVSSDTWEVTERDGAGAYLVRYERVDDTHLSKTKLRYTQLSPQATPALQAGGGLVVDKSSATLQLRDDGFLLELSSEESVRATGDTLGGVSSTTKLKLTYLRSARTSPTQLASLQDVPEPTGASNEYAQEGGYSVEADRARIAGRSVDDFMADLNSLPRDDKAYSEADRNKQRRAFIGLAASFRRNPEAVKKVMEIIKAGSSWSSFLWDALGSAGSPEAQAALRELIDMPQWNEEQRLAQMIDLSMVERPTTETVGFLQGKLDDPEQHTQARYGLGSAAHSLQQVEPARATEIVAELNRQIARAPGDATRVEYLKALGNTGHPDAMPHILAQLSAPEVHIRMTALDALRFMEGPDVNGRIVAAMRSDEDHAVRFAATTVAEYRPPDDELLQALVLTWKHDSSEDVQKGARATILRLDGRFPGLMAKLESLYASL